MGSREKVSRFRLGTGRFIVRGWVDFHGDAEVKTPHSQFRGHGFYPWWGNRSRMPRSAAKNKIIIQCVVGDVVHFRRFLEVPLELRKGSV